MKSKNASNPSCWAVEWGITESTRSPCPPLLIFQRSWKYGSGFSFRGAPSNRSTNLLAKENISSDGAETSVVKCVEYHAGRSTSFESFFGGKSVEPRLKPSEIHQASWKKNLILHEWKAFVTNEDRNMFANRLGDISQVKFASRGENNINTAFIHDQCTKHSRC